MTETVADAFRFRIAPRWGDLDAMNHVNNATYLRYLEEARIQWLNALGTEWFDENLGPVLASATLDYRLPIGYPSTIDIELFAVRVGNSSLTIGHRMLDADSGALHCDGQVVVVWIERASGKPTPLPEAIRRAAEAIASPD